MHYIISFAKTQQYLLHNLKTVRCTAKDIPQIDIPTLLKAFGIIAEKEPRITFGIFADVAQLQIWNIPDMVDVYNLQDRCSILNPQPEINFGFPSMGELYASMDLFVSLHQEENINISALEASYCGVPMILPRGGATEEYLPDETVFLEKSDIFVAPPHNTRYRVYDAEEVAEKTMHFYHDGETKIKTVRTELQRLDWNMVGKEWVKLMM